MTSPRVQHPGIGANIASLDSPDRLLFLLLEQETKSQERALAIIFIKKSWEESLRAVDAELGAKARPMSAAVKLNLAERLGLPVTLVEAGMMRWARAVQRVRASQVGTRVLH